MSGQVTEAMVGAALSSQTIDDAGEPVTLLEILDFIDEGEAHPIVRAALEAAIAAMNRAAQPAPAPGGQVPDGWRLVPVEPTETMSWAGWRSKGVFSDGMRSNAPEASAIVYRAMLAAAPPAPPAEASDGSSVLADHVKNGNEDRIERLQSPFYIRWTRGVDYERAFLCLEDGEPDMLEFASVSFKQANLFKDGMQALVLIAALPIEDLRQAERRWGYKLDELMECQLRINRAAPNDDGESPRLNREIDRAQRLRTEVLTALGAPPAEAPPPHGWRPIETCPPHVKTAIIGGRYPNGLPWAEESFRHPSGHWNARKLEGPTHWQPMPSAETIPLPGQFEAPLPEHAPAVDLGAGLRAGLEAAASLLRRMADAKEANARGDLGGMFASQSAVDLRAAADRVVALAAERDGSVE